GGDCPRPHKTDWCQRPPLKHRGLYRTSRPSLPCKDALELRPPFDHNGFERLIVSGVEKLEYRYYSHQFRSHLGMSVGPTVASIAEAHHRTSKGGSYAFSLNRGSDYL